MKTRILLLTTILLCGAATLLAALSPEKAAWARGPVQFLMTKEEMNTWSSLQKDEDADAFIAAFWARRDATPGTAANEFRDEFDRRVQFADQSFEGPRGRGSLSDMGKILVLFGPPSKRIRSGGEGRGTITTPGTAPGTTLPETSPNEATDTENSEKQIWVYENELAQKLFAVPRVEFRFADRLNNRDFRMETPRIDLNAAQQRVISASIIQPIPAKAPTQQTVVVQMPVTPVVPTTLKTAALETAIADAKSGEIPSKGSTIISAEFVSPAGDYYVPIGLFVPSSAGLTTDAVDTFFGVIEDAAGKRVEVFEDPAKGMVSRNSLLFDRTATLPSGKYTATFGLAKAGAPVLIASAPLELNALTKEATGTSRLILSDIVETLEAAPIRTPFAFGKLKLVPRTAFTNKDELGYFIEIHNPGLDATTNLPKLQTKIDLITPTGSISAPLSDAQALPLSGGAGPGQYAIISSIPLSELSKPLAPGDYTLRVKIVDMVSKQSNTVEQKFKIVG